MFYKPYQTEDGIIHARTAQDVQDYFLSGTSVSGNVIRSIVHVGNEQWKIEDRNFDEEPKWDNSSRFENFLKVWGFKSKYE